jgi:glycosyltransferase involved in cell wall biosynthesis
MGYTFSEGFFSRAARMFAASNSMRLSIYVNAYLERTESSVYQQIRGLARSAEVQVLARRGRCIDEFPIGNLFIEEDHRTLGGWLRQRIRPRLARRTENPFTVPKTVARRIARQAFRWRSECLYTVFAWNGIHGLDIRSLLRERVPLVVLCAGTDIAAAESLGDFYIQRLAELFSESDLLMAASKFLREKMIRLGADPEKTIVHYIGVDVPSFSRSKKDHEKGPFRILMASRLEPVKGVMLSLESVAGAASRMGEFELTILGDGSEMKPCKELVRDLGIEKKVHFRGMVARALVLKEMEKADILIQHNVVTEDGQEECLSLSVLEAMARETPAIVTRSGGMTEAVENGVSGIVVSSGDVVTMADAIVSLARDAGRREKLGRRARARVLKKFDLKVQNLKLAHEISRVVQKSRVGRKE